MTRVEPITPEHWGEPVTRRVLGIVPDEAVRRHPSDLWRVGAAAVLVAVTGVMALHVSAFEEAGYELMASIPDSCAAFCGCCTWPARPAYSSAWSSRC